MHCLTRSQSILSLEILNQTHLASSPKFSSMSRHSSAMILISTRQIITYSTDMWLIEYLNMQLSTSRIMICESAYKQISYYSSRIISDNWTSQSEKFCLITAILTSTELITTAKEECSKISWKRSVSMLNTTATESRIKLSESSIIIDICSKTFNSKNMSYTTLFSSKCQSSSSKHRRRSSHTHIRSRHILRTSEKTSDISRSVNRLINQSQSIRSIESVNQLISRHQSFRSRHQLLVKPHSDNFNHSTLNYHTIHHTLQSISSIIRTINHSMHQSISTRFSSHSGHHTSAIKFDLSRKHLNRIYLNQFNYLNLHLNHLNHRNHLHLHSHQHLKSHSNRFTSVNHINRVNHLTTRMIDSNNWRYWIKSIRRTKNSVTRAATLILKCWNFMISVDVRDYSSTYICKVSRSCLQTRHLTTIIQICNFAIHFMKFVST
jgi:hypothetical protein